MKSSPNILKNIFKFLKNSNTTKNNTKRSIVEYRKLRGMCDLFNYLLQIDECTVLNKDGAISRHYIYTAPDLDSCTGEDLDFVSDTWANSFSFLGNGWMVETNVASKKYQPDAKNTYYPEVVSALIDDERRLQYDDGDYFTTTYYLTITYKPEKMVESKLRTFAIDDDKKVDGFETLLEEFNKQASEYIGYLKRAMHSIEPLRGNQLTSFLYYCHTHSNQKLSKSDIGCFLDTYIAEPFTGGFKPTVAEKHIRILCLDDIPSYSYPAILDMLSYLPIEYRWSSRYICLDKLTAKNYLKKYERNWSSKAIGVMGVLREAVGVDPKIDPDAQNTANILKHAQYDSSSGALNYGFYNSSLVFIHEDQDYLEKIVDEVKSKIQQLEFKVRVETVNAAESYLGSLPGHGDYNLRKMLQDTRFVSHVLPTSSLYQGEMQAPCPLSGYKDAPGLLMTTTKGNRPFMLNLHIGDVGHTAILGPTGMGKTTLMSAIACSHRKYEGSRVVVLDKDHSNEVWIRALSGQYVDPEKQQFSLAPFSRLTKDNQDSQEKALEWLKSICSVQGIEMTPGRIQSLREAVERLSTEEQDYKNLDHITIQDPILREAIQAFNSGMAQNILNGTAPAFSGCDVLGFEMSSLIKTDASQRDTSIAVIKAVFNEIESLFQDRKPTLLILEEAWLYLKHPLFLEKLTDWFKTLRKKNVSVVFISQDLDDIVKSNAASVIQTSCMTRIFLPNSKAAEPNIMAQYESFGLNSEQIQIIREAIPKRDYYYQSIYGNRLFNLDLGPLAQAFLCLSSKDELDTFYRMSHSVYPTWIACWLEHKGLKEWAEYTELNYIKEAQHA